MPNVATSVLTDQACKHPAPKAGRFMLRDARAPGLEIRISTSAGGTVRRVAALVDRRAAHGAAARTQHPATIIAEVAIL